MKTSFVTVPYDSADSVQKVLERMQSQGYELVFDHKDAKLLDFAIRAENPTGRPSFRARVSMTLFFGAITLLALELVGGHVTRLFK